MDNEKYLNKYRIPSARLESWDYRWKGAYFITICTHEREHYFGEIKKSKRYLSQVGVIADLIWYEIKYHTKNVQLGNFIVMPNHVHGILILNDENNDDCREVACNVSTINAMSSISPKPNSISTIIRSYKSAVTKHANRFEFEFKWQTRFHDHIIRDEKSFNTISEYIIHNPEKWEEDKFYQI